MTVKKLVALTPDMARAIDGYRFDSRFPSESEAIRRLIELGLEAARRGGDSPPLQADAARQR